MKTRSLLAMTAIGLTAAAVAAPALALQEKSFFEQAGSEAKYTPGDFKPASDRMKTRFGTLEFPGGYPTEETVQKVYDELDRQRATQLYLDMYPALSAHGLMKGWVRDYGRDISRFARFDHSRCQYFSDSFIDAAGDRDHDRWLPREYFRCQSAG